MSPLLGGRRFARPAEAIGTVRPLRAAALAGVAVLSLSGCGVRAKREALRSCSFAPAGVKTHVVGDSVVMDVGLEIRNPGPGKAVLDSFAAIASGGSPLARLSHGSTLELPAGSVDTALLHVVLSKQSLISTAMVLMMSPPDSVRVEGTAWLPGLFGGLRAHPLRAVVPWSSVGGHLQSLLPGL